LAQLKEQMEGAESKARKASKKPASEEEAS
jgi:small subunit ribosomal protein S1